MAAKKSCIRCGHEQGLFNMRNIYACKAPHCRSFGACVCEKCLKEMGVEIPIFATVRCPTCGVGEMKNLGMG